MTNDDIVRLANALKALGETFNEPVSDVRAEAYLFALEDLTIDDVEYACRQAIKYGKFFPRPVELREAIEGSQGDRAQTAWMELVGEIRRVGWYGTPRLTATTYATMEGLWGSWAYLCQTLPGEGPELLGWQKRWESAYGATSGRLERGELIGRDEAKRILGVYLGPDPAKPQQLPEADAREVPTLSYREPVAAHDPSGQGRSRAGR